MKRLFDGLNQLLIPEEEVQQPVSIVPPREPDSAYHDAVFAVERVDMHRVSQLAFNGVPDELRGTYWKLMLGCLPPERSHWATVTQNSRNSYRQLLASILQEPKDASVTDHVCCCSFAAADASSPQETQEMMMML